MLKKSLVLVAAFAVVAASLNAAPVLQFWDLGAGSGGEGGVQISSSGDYVAGYATDSTVAAYTFPAYWTMSPNTGAAPVRTNVVGGWGAGYIGGIDQKNGARIWTGVNAGSTTYSTANFVGRYGTPTVAGGLRDHNGTSSNAIVGGNNSVSATSNGADMWAAGLWTSGTTSKGNNGQIWKTVNGVFSPDSRATYSPTGSGKVTLRSIASNGNAIGDDRSGVSYSGAAGAQHAVYWTTANTANVVGIPSFAGNGTVTHSQGFGVSDNGKWFSGLMYLQGDSTYEAFRWKMGDANATKLTNLIPTGLGGTTYVAYDITNDGTAVGSTFMDDSNRWNGLAGNHDVGTIYWADGGASRVVDVLSALGLYNNSIRFVGRTYGIAELGNGFYSISGSGSFWTNAEHTTFATRDFYAVIPEPATLLFLALGSVALMRRRR